MPKCANCRWKLMAQFVPPTVQEVKDFARSIGWEEFDAQYFVDKQSTIGWIDNKGRQIKDWQALLRIWFRAAISRGEIKTTPKNKTFLEMQNDIS